MDTNVVPSWITPLQIEFQTSQKEFSIFAKERFSAKNPGPFIISNYIHSILYQWKQHCTRHVITQPHCKVLTLAQLKREHPEVDFDGWCWTQFLSHFTTGCGSESFQLSNKKQYTKNWWYFDFVTHFSVFHDVPCILSTKQLQHPEHGPFEDPWGSNSSVQVLAPKELKPQTRVGPPTKEPQPEGDTGRSELGLKCQSEAEFWMFCLGWNDVWNLHQRFQKKTGTETIDCLCMQDFVHWTSQQKCSSLRQNRTNYQSINSSGVISEIGHDWTLYSVTVEGGWRCSCVPAFCHIRCPIAPGGKACDELGDFKAAQRKLPSFCRAQTRVV